MAEKEKNHPVEVFQSGRVKASIWQDQKVINNDLVNVHTIKIERSYKNDFGDWINTNFFFVDDLPKVVLVANEAFRFLRLTPPETEPSDKKSDIQECKEGHYSQPS
jgi:hypothetical protein